MVRTVNILGTEYRIEVHKRSEDEYMRKNGADGYCSDDAKLIVIADTSENESFPDMTDIEQSASLHIESDCYVMKLHMHS